MANERLHALDAFRGIAALAVVFFHIGLRYPGLMRGEPIGTAPLFPGFTERDAGIVPVLWFFLISGFVITWTIDRCRTPADFVVGRFSRLYPAYWASLAFTVTLIMAFPLPHAAAPSVSAVLVNVTMLQDYVLVPNVAGVYWSLGVELLFYAYALALFASGLWRFVHVAALAWAVLGLVAALLSWRGVALPWRVSQLLLLTYAPFLVAGMMLYQFWRRQRPVWTAATLVLCLAAVVAAYSVVPAAISIGGMGLIAWATRGGLRWLSLAPLVWLGSISYALYLSHEDAAYIILNAAAGVGAPGWLGALLAIGAALLIASAISYGVERPAMRALRGAWRARTLTRGPDPAGVDPLPPAGPRAPGSPG